MPACLSQAFAPLNLVVAGDNRIHLVVLEMAVRQGFELGAPLMQRHVYQRTAAGVGEQIEYDENRRRLHGEAAYSARGWMDAREQGVEPTISPSMAKDRAFTSRIASTNSGK